MKEAILQAIRDIERDNGVRILYACESGSRAWGFASPDSDFDVRFIYIHKRDWYLSIDQRRDVIEAMLPGDLDLAGWDIRKALGLLRKSNPSLLEWLRSPIVYQQDDAFTRNFLALSEKYASLERTFRHYLHMAEGNWRTYLLDEQVSYKKYLYVLRPVLACRWIERKQTLAPMVFDELLAVLDDPETLSAVYELLRVKQASAEVAKGLPVPTLQIFLSNELSRLQKISWERGDLPPIESLNQFFRDQLDIFDKMPMR